MKRTIVLLIGVVAVGCGGSEPTVDVRATPSTGAAPLAVTFDATGSRDDDNPAVPLTARFDFDGDGSWDTDAGADLTATYVYPEGRYTARVEITSVADRVGVGEVTVDVKTNTPPVAAVTVSPTSGRAPLLITADASTSSDVDEDFTTLEVRFDFDSDGTFDTEYNVEKVATHTFQRAGTYQVTVEVKDRAGATTTAMSKEAVTVAAGADIDADTDRNGVIDDLDEANEDNWTVEHGAVFIANVDDDDFDGARDGINPAFEGGNDTADFVQVLVRRNSTLTAQDSVTLEVSPAAAANNVRIVTAVGVGLEVVHDLGRSGPQPLDAAALTNGDMLLLMEGVHTRSADWDGRVTLTLSMTAAGETLTDTVELRIAPVVFTDNTRPAERLFVMRIADRRFGPNLEFYNPLSSMLPDGIDLYSADEYEYFADRWLQDNMQTGYQSMPGPNGLHVMKTHLETQRPTGNQGLEPFLTQELLGADVGYEYPGRSRDSSLNYGGNLEVAPPHGDYPLGRLIAGGGSLGTINGIPWSDAMSEGQTAWLNAQEIQGPMVQVSSEWLVVGHVDEIFLFIPNKNAGPDERPWKVVIASPTLARTQLQQVSAQGGDNLVVFQGRETQSTVGRILGDTQFMDYQDAVQARIDTVREILETSFDLSDEDFVEVPVLYEWYFFDGLDLSAAFNPGIQNLIVANDELFIPDPEGPVFEGTDIWRASAEQTFTALGLTSHFVDVFESYHLNLGEAHCGTEVEGTHYDEPWWLHDRLGVMQ